MLVVSILKKEQFNPKIRIGEDTELWSRIAINYCIYFHNKKTYVQIEHTERSVNDYNSIIESKIPYKLF